MRIVSGIIRVYSKGYEAIDLLPEVVGFIEKHGLRDGLIHVSTRKPCVFPVFIEYEPNLLRDFEDLLNKMFNETNRCLAETVFGKTVIIPVVDGEVSTGVFKHPVLIDLSLEKGEKEVLLIYEGL